MTGTVLELPIEAGAGEASPVEKYKFDSSFQSKIAALILRDTPFMQRVDGLVRPEYFESPSEALLVQLAIRYFEKYKKIPADRTIYKILIRDDLVAKTMRPEDAKLALTILDKVFESDISDRDYVVDQVATFARHQAVAAAFYDGIHKLDKKDFTGIEKLMKRALDVGANVDVGAYDFGENIALRTGERLDKAAGKLPPTGITTGYPIMDAELYHRGWGRRELSVLMGGAKAGKTTALINFGINALAAGYNVLYLTLEVAAKIVAERMDANIADTAVFELGDRVHEVREKVQEFMERARATGAGMGNHGKFVIQEYPTGSMTVSDLRRLIDRYKARGIKFDLIVVDYADLMAPERVTDNAIENSKSVYVNLRGLAMQEDVAVLTATQTNRTGHKAATITAEHVAEDFNKIRIADIIISLNRTDDERAVKQCRLYFAACRNQAGGFSIRVEQDLDRMRFITKIVGVE